MNDWQANYTVSSSSNGSFSSYSTTNNATATGTFIWNGQPGFDTDDGDGSAPVREPRRPKPSPLAPAAAEAELELCFV